MHRLFLWAVALLALPLAATPVAARKTQGLALTPLEAIIGPRDTLVFRLTPLAN